LETLCLAEALGGGGAAGGVADDAQKDRLAAVALLGHLREGGPGFNAERGGPSSTGVKWRRSVRKALAAYKVDHRYHLWIFYRLEAKAENKL
jgi:hypothetical protein